MAGMQKPAVCGLGTASQSAIQRSSASQEPAEGMAWLQCHRVLRLFGPRSVLHGHACRALQHLQRRPINSPARRA